MYGGTALVSALWTKLLPIHYFIATFSLPLFRTDTSHLLAVASGDKQTKMRQGTTQSRDLE